MSRVPGVKVMTVKQGNRAGISQYPNFHRTGSIKGMRRFYGSRALMVRCGSYIYHVPKRIYDQAH